MSDLVRNLNCVFSHVAAQIVSYFQKSDLVFTQNSYLVLLFFNKYKISEDYEILYEQKFPFFSLQYDSDKAKKD